MPLTPETVRAVARLLHETDLSEIEIETTSSPGASNEDEANENPRVRLQMRRGSSPVVPRRIVANAAAPVAATTDASTAPTSVPVVVVSPSVGIFRNEKVALQVGDNVKKGQIVGRVEALKIPTDVLSPTDGRVLHVLVEEGQGVEYNQTLLEIEAASPS